MKLFLYSGHYPLFILYEVYICPTLKLYITVYYTANGKVKTKFAE